MHMHACIDFSHDLIIVDASKITNEIKPNYSIIVYLNDE